MRAFPIFLTPGINWANQAQKPSKQKTLVRFGVNKPVFLVTSEIKALFQVLSPQGNYYLSPDWMEKGIQMAFPDVTFAKAMQIPGIW